MKLVWGSSSVAVGQRDVRGVAKGEEAEDDEEQEERRDVEVRRRLGVEPVQSAAETGAAPGR